MRVGPAVKETDLRIVPPSVAVVADVQRLVEVADQVDEEPKRETLVIRSVTVATNLERRVVRPGMIRSRAPG